MNKNESKSSGKEPVILNRELDQMFAYYFDHKYSIISKIYIKTSRFKNIDAYDFDPFNLDSNNVDRFNTNAKELFKKYSKVAGSYFVVGLIYSLFKTRRIYKQGLGFKSILKLWTLYIGSFLLLFIACNSQMNKRLFTLVDEAVIDSYIEETYRGKEEDSKVDNRKKLLMNQLDLYKINKFNSTMV